MNFWERTMRQKRTIWPTTRGARGVEPKLPTGKTVLFCTFPTFWNLHTASTANQMFHLSHETNQLNSSGSRHFLADHRLSPIPVAAFHIRRYTIIPGSLRCHRLRSPQQRHWERANEKPFCSSIGPKHANSFSDYHYH